MSDAAGKERLLRGAVIAVFVVCAVLVARIVLSAVGGDDEERVVWESPELRSGEVRVEQALSIDSDQPLTVRGFIFNDGEQGLRLCDRIQHGDPPKCVGPFISLDTPDTSRFALETGTDADGFPVAWVEEAVAIRGMVNVSIMTVDQILQ